MGHVSLPFPGQRHRLRLAQKSAGLGVYLQVEWLQEVRTVASGCSGSREPAGSWEKRPDGWRSPGAGGAR
jgi:hypothetical protein